MSDVNPWDAPEDDPILAEIRQYRDQRAAKFGYDVERMLEASRRTQYFLGVDLVERSESGEFVVVFKGTGKFDLEAIEAIEQEIMNRGPKDG